MKIGIGYDAHRLVDGRRLFLGGIHVPYGKGLLGHSDGDVLIHAICDAILGAISEGDIGVHFPDSDESIKNIESVKILAYVSELAKRKGYRIINIDAVVIAEEPKISPYREKMKERLAEVLGIDAALVGIKGKTTEGMGFIGRKEGIEVQAVALLEIEQ
ncbi:MAG: 2-C-methyl-D-erythritol 2,4-cyclodiphosphate synthase [Syntrophus sp. (in: bacteria)]|nr:2-C-methyl-D-erythritol 2,4-cyclodiphosphate synthase [Syntrophus sp. (in: bacteria)]